MSTRADARGLINLQIALAGGGLFVLEANPRASRTVPFVAKAAVLPLVEHACRLLLGQRLEDLRLPERAERPTGARCGRRDEVAAGAASALRCKGRPLSPEANPGRS